MRMEDQLSPGSPGICDDMAAAQQRQTGYLGLYQMPPPPHVLIPRSSCALLALPFGAGVLPMLLLLLLLTAGAERGGKR